VVGFERQLHDQDAGIRTHLLVALGSAFFRDGLPVRGLTAFAEEHDRPVVAAELAHVDEAFVSRLGDLEYVIGLRWAGS